MKGIRPEQFNLTSDQLIKACLPKIPACSRKDKEMQK